MDIKNNVIYADSLFRPKSISKEEFLGNLGDILYDMVDVLDDINDNLTYALNENVDGFGVVDYMIICHGELDKLKKLISRSENEMVKYFSGVKYE